MTGDLLALPRRWSAIRRQRVALVVLIAFELGLLALAGTRLVQVRVVEDRRELVGNVETIHFRNEIVGDPPLLGLVLLGVGLPLISRQRRREPVLLVATQAAIVGLITFVFWPLAQVFVEGFRAGQGAEGFSLIQFEKLLETPMVARAARGTLVIGVTSAVLSTVIGTLVAYTLTLTDVP